MARKRISKVTTRTGDRGTTSLATGRSVGKFEPIVLTMGSVDELNSQVGVLRQVVAADHQPDLATIQQALFDLGAVFAMEGEYTAPQPDHLETATDALNAELAPLTEFVLPGGGQAAAQSHVCRAVCRRAETAVWGLLEDYAQSGASASGEPGPTPAAYGDAARYLNRLSDYFFVLARFLTEDTETQWQGPKA